MIHTVFLVRHGQTVWNLEKRIQGRLNSPLTDLGREQARVSASVLKKENVTRIIASPADRVRETLNQMRCVLDVPISFDKRLLERDMGMWEQMEWDTVKRNWAIDYKRCRNNPRTERPPHGESLQDVENRLSSLLNELSANTSENEGNIALVSHGGTTRSIFGWFGVMEQLEFQNIRFHNDVVYRLMFDDREFYVSHYVAGEGPIEGVCTEIR